MSSPADKPLKVLYLFNGSRVGLIDKIKRGEAHRNGFWGMLQLPEHGIEADYLELEDIYPVSVTRLLRRLIPIYFVHLAAFWKFFKYDIVYTSTAFGSQLFFTALRSLGIPVPRWVMQSFSITGLLGKERTFRQKIFRFIVKRADGIITVGKHETDLLKGRFPHLRDQIEFIPFGVDTKFFRPNSSVKEEEGILAVGLDPDRDWKTFFEAVKNLPVKVTVATRPERVKRLQIPSNVRITQFTPRGLVTAYAKAAIVAVPLDTSTGVNDAMGCSTVFEAMAMGKALVATRTHTIESYITEGKNGIMVAEKDIAGWQNTLDNLLKDKEKREAMGSSARAYAEANLNMDKLAGELAAFFKRIAFAR